MTDTSISPLRQRMIEDMTVRGFTRATQRSYITIVREFSLFLGRSPDQANAEDLRRYQLHMRSSGVSENMPRPTGEKATSAVPSALQASRTAISGLRTISEYSDCIAAIG